MPFKQSFFLISYRVSIDITLTSEEKEEDSDDPEYEPSVIITAML